jgi:hypothetical protein
MTLAPKGKFRPTLKLKLGTKALICAALVIAVVADVGVCRSGPAGY